MDKQIDAALKIDEVKTASTIHLCDGKRKEKVVPLLKIKFRHTSFDKVSL